MISPGDALDMASAKLFEAIVAEIINDIPIKNNKKEILFIFLYDIIY